MRFVTTWRARAMRLLNEEKMMREKTTRYKPHNLARLDILDGKRRTKLFALLELRFSSIYK